MNGITTKEGDAQGVQEVLADASPECKAALVEILRLERDHLSQKSPNASKLARTTAEIIRKAVP